MKKILHYIFIFIIPLGLVSCASYKGFPDRVLKPQDELEHLKVYYSEKEVDRYNSAVSEEVRKRIRNEVINGRIAAIDLQFSLFQKGLREDGLNVNVGTDAIILGLSAAGAVVSGGTSQILSATTAAVAGLRESIDKNAFYEQTMPALFAQMIAQRKKVLVKIRTGLVHSTIDYPLQQGFADLEDYQYAGSIPGSIATIVEDAGVTSANATENLNKVLKINFEDSEIKRLEDSLGPVNSNIEFEPAKVKKIKRCWKQTGVPENTLLLDFLSDDKFAEKRKEVNKCVDKLGN